MLLWWTGCSIMVTPTLPDLAGFCNLRTGAKLRCAFRHSSHFLGCPPAAAPGIWPHGRESGTFSAFMPPRHDALAALRSRSAPLA